MEICLSSGARIRQSRYGDWILFQLNSTVKSHRAVVVPAGATEKEVESGARARLGSPGRPVRYSVSRDSSGPVTAVCSSPSQASREAGPHLAIQSGFTKEKE